MRARWGKVLFKVQGMIATFLTRRFTYMCYVCFAQENESNLTMRMSQYDSQSHNCCELRFFILPRSELLLTYDFDLIVIGRVPDSDVLARSDITTSNISSEFSNACTNSDVSSIQICGRTAHHIMTSARLEKRMPQTKPHPNARETGPGRGTDTSTYLGLINSVRTSVVKLALSNPSQASYGCSGGDRPTLNLDCSLFSRERERGRGRHNRPSTLFLLLATPATVLWSLKFGWLCQRLNAEYLDVHLIHHRCAFVHNMLLFVGQD